MNSETPEFEPDRDSAPERWNTYQIYMNIANSLKRYGEVFKAAELEDLAERFLYGNQQEGDGSKIMDLIDYNMQLMTQRIKSQTQSSLGNQPRFPRPRRFRRRGGDRGKGEGPHHRPKN